MRSIFLISLFLTGCDHSFSFPIQKYAVVCSQYHQLSIVNIRADGTTVPVTSGPRSYAQTCVVNPDSSITIK
jgi:hypothetical protein